MLTWPCSFLLANTTYILPTCSYVWSSATHCVVAYVMIISDLCKLTLFWHLMLTLMLPLSNTQPSHFSKSDTGLCALLTPSKINCQLQINWYIMNGWLNWHSDTWNDVAWDAAQTYCNLGPVRGLDHLTLITRLCLTRLCCLGKLALIFVWCFLPGFSKAGSLLMDTVLSVV